MCKVAGRKSFRGARRFAASSIITIVLCSSVFAEQLPPPSELFPHLKRPETTVASKKLTVKIFIDATSSMRGFAGPNSNDYRQHLHNIEESLQFGWQQVAVECFKFGTKSIPVSKGSCYAAAGQKNFYKLPKEQDFTKIETVVSQADKGWMTIIITDLYEDEVDLGSLFQAFKESAFSKDLAVGIVAMRANFDGDIYDIGFSKATRPWHHPRPFYALVVGSGPDVDVYFEQLSRGAVPKEQLLILSGNLLKQPVSWQSSIRTHPKGVAVDPSMAQIKDGGSRYGLLRIQESDSACDLELKFQAEYLPFRPNLDWKDIAHEDLHIKVKRIGRKGTGEDTGPKDLLECTLKPPEKPKTPEMPEKTDLILRLTWNPRRMSPDRFYAAEIDLDLGSTNMPSFVHEWSITPDGAESTRKFDGSRTQCLEALVSGLWRSLLQVEEPSLGSVYVYFRR